MWKTVKLGECCLVTDYVANGSFQSLRENVTYLDNDGYAVLVRLTDYTKGWNGRYKYVSEESYKFLGKSALYPGDLVISNVGEPGKTFLVPDLGKPMTLGPNSILVRPNEKILHTNFLKYYIDSEFGRHLISSIVSGTTQSKFNKTDFRALSIFLPPLAEQQRIVEKLDRAFAEIDELIKVNENLNLSIKSLREIAVSNFFSNLLDCEEKSLKEVCEKITDGTHQTPTYFDDGYIFLSSKNVTQRKIDWINVRYIDKVQHLLMQKRIKPQKGDVLLAKNGTTGVAAIVDKDIEFDIYVSLALLRTKGEVLPEYLLAYINSDLAKKQFAVRTKGIGVPNLHLQEIREVTIKYPKSLDEQKNLISFFKKVEDQSTRLTDLIERKSNSLVLLKSAILKQALQPQQ